MKKNKKYIILGVVSIILIISVIVVIVLSKNNGQSQEEQEENKTINYEDINLNDMGILDNVKVEGDKKINTSEKVLAERKLEGLTIKNISLISDKGITTFKATVINEKAEVSSEKKIKIILKDKEGNEYGIIEGLIDKIQPHSETTIDASINLDLSNAYDFSIEI